MAANLKEVDVPNNLYEFFKQADPNLNYLFKFRYKPEFVSTYKETWVAAKVKMDFSMGHFGLQCGDEMKRLRTDKDLNQIVEMYEIDELFDMIKGK